ncbi:D-galacturonate reductase [Vitis vinifera]|uniref:D-galacturonate reductase n=1 Tax=Vitis vinifera TaxID=29760 RepID=A0A438FLG5_VITVI|nr:D-galacturonate reductase [Vitis vinifera]
MALMVPKVSIGANGRAMPVIGMGTASLSPEAMLEAIRIGYRHFDTAFVDELFITSKLWCTSAEKDLVVPAIKKSLGNLQLEYLDLFLIHWPLRLSKEMRQIPVPKEDLLPIDIKSLWEGMEECQNMGLTKAIGVEMHPMWQQKELVDFCKTKGIHVTAYSPLGAISTSKRNNQTVASSLVEEIAKAHGKTSAQSGNKKRMKENLMIFDWALSGEELNKLTQLPQHKMLRPSSFLGSHDLVLETEEGI